MLLLLFLIEKQVPLFLSTQWSPLFHFQSRLTCLLIFLAMITKLQYVTQVIEHIVLGSEAHNHGY